MQQKNDNGLVSHPSLHQDHPQPATKHINMPNEEHHDTCTCILCQKQQEIEQLRKQRTKLHFQSLYKNDFVNNKYAKRSNKYNKAENQTQLKRERKQKSLAQIQTYNMGYLEIQSTYNNEYVSKQIQISKTRPLDNLRNASAIVPVSTTYLKSYHSVFTPKPDETFKQIQMPVGTTAIPFSSQSVYQKAYKRQYSPRPNLPFIQRQNMSKPKSLGPVQSTQKQSYSTMILNPESKNIEHIVFKQPPGNLVNLSSFGHNYETTYRNCFMGAPSRSQHKHDINEIGNINWRVLKKQKN